MNPTLRRKESGRVGISLDRHFEADTVPRAAGLCAGVLMVSYAITMFVFSISNVPFPMCPLGGVGLAAVILFAERNWLGFAAVWLALTLAQFLTALSVGVTLPSSIAYGIEEPLSILFAGWTLRRLRFDPSFASIRDVGLLIGGALSIPFTSYIIHRVSFYYLFNIYPTDPARRPWDFWYFILSDGNAVLLLTPFLLFVARGRRFFEREQIREALLLFSAVTLTVLALFFTPPFLVPFQQTLAYIAFPGIIWAGLRFGLPGVAAVVLLFGIESFCGAKWGTLPFHGATPAHELMAFQFFIATTSLTGLLLGAVCEERRTILARLQKSEGELQALLDYSPMAVLMKDLQGRIILANRACEQTFQFSLEDLRGRTLEEIARGDHPPPVLSGSRWIEESKRTDAAVAATLRAAFFEIVVPGPEGMIHHSVIKFPILGPDGRAKAIAAISIDETERRRLEEQLRQSQKMDALGQLAGGVAHDFNNILTAIILGLGELADDPDLSSGTRESMQEVQGLAERAANLTRQLLMFSRQSVMEARPIQLNHVLENILKMLRSILDGRVEIEFHAGSDVPWIEADAGMLEQVVVNLAVNARDAMAQRGRLTITTDAVEFDEKEAALHPGGAAGRFARLAVRDTGQGIEPAVLGQIFEPFFTTKEVGQGSGLGLATVYGIVEQHRGWIEVESEVGKGSEFTIFLPAMDGDAPALETTPGISALAAPTGTETILVVEDERIIRQRTSKCLRAAGYRVLEAADGPDALALWERHRAEIDLLFTDMVMPQGMTGIELAERLRGEKPALEVIVTSGYNVERVGQELLPDSMTYLPKPFHASTVGALVRKCLDRRKAGPLA
jgi:PAS domain S-box-containing protein